MSKRLTNLVYVRVCKRCHQQVLASALGLAQHGAVCLRFDMRDRVIRGLSGRRYVPEDSRPVIFLQKLRPSTRGMRGRHR